MNIAKRLMYVNKLPAISLNKRVLAIIDTGATMPVCTLSIDVLYRTFNGCYDTGMLSILSGFGNKSVVCNVMCIPDLQIVDDFSNNSMHMLNVPVACCIGAMSYNFLLPYTVFGNCGLYFDKGDRRCVITKYTRPIQCRYDYMYCGDKRYVDNAYAFIGK